MFSNYWISSKRSVPYIKMFSTLSGVRTVFQILPQLGVLCTSAVKRHCSKNHNSPFTRHLFSRAFEFMKARKTCHRVDQPSVSLIPYSAELCNKNCIVETSETFTTGARRVTLLGPISQTQQEGCQTDC